MYCNAKVMIRWDRRSRLEVFTRKQLCSSLFFLIKLQASGTNVFLWTGISWHKCFPKNTFLQGTPFYKEHLWWLFLLRVRFNIENMFFSYHHHNIKFSHHHYHYKYKIQFRTCFSGISGLQGVFWMTFESFLSLASYLLTFHPSRSLHINSVDVFQVPPLNKLLRNLNF